MKASFLITSLQLLNVLVNGQGGLRTGIVEGDPSFQLLLDSDDNHRHELERQPHHHQENLLVDTHRNLTSTNQQLPAGNVGARGGQGTMFYIKTKRAVRITGFDIYSQTRSDSDPVQVYTRRGKYNGNIHSSTGWELVYQNSATRLLGDSTPTHLSISSVTVPANTFQSFFIWTKKNNIKYRTGTSEGNVWSNDNNLILYEGIGKSTKFSGNNNNVERPRIFRGSIKYDEINNNANSNANANANANRGVAIDPLSIGGFSKSSRIACLSNQVRVSLEVKTDQNGEQTSWSMRKKGTTQLVYAGPDANNNYSYKSRTSYSGTMCVDVGMYEFKVEDRFNDGMCCSAGQGYYNIDVETKAGSWRKAVRGSKFLGSKVHVVDIGEQESMMTERDAMYLESHNRRRIDWHARYNKEYIPLKWSKGLKDSSMEYARELLETCHLVEVKHASNNPYGENIGRNKGNELWGQLYPPDNIVRRFVEHEEGLPWARNGHLTNVLWRATQYVGCAEASKTYQVNNGKTHTCRTQVCRYAKPGNCSMGKYKDPETGIVDWETPMLMDDSPCKPDCPPEGCYE